MSTSVHLSCGMQDAQLDNWLDLVLSHAPQISCPECRAAFFALKGNGSYRCPECGLVLAVDLNSGHENAKQTAKARGDCAVKCNVSCQVNDGNAFAQRSPGSFDPEKPMLTPAIPPLNRSLAIAGLSRICAEWVEATAQSGETLEETSEGLLIADIAEAIGLTPEEVALVMGRVQ